MSIFKKSTDKLEGKLQGLALLIGIIGIILTILGIVLSGIVDTTDNNDNLGSGNNSSNNNGNINDNTIGYYGTYHNSTTMEGINLKGTLIISATSCKITFELEQQGISASFTDNCTYTYVTSAIAQQTEKNTKYEGCNALLICGNEDAVMITDTTVLWIVKEQKGNYQFALSGIDGSDGLIFS